MKIKSSAQPATGATCTGDWSRAKVPGQRSHYGTERAARSLLSELAARESEDVPLHHDAAHVLVTSATTRKGGAAIDQLERLSKSVAQRRLAWRKAHATSTQLPAAASSKR